MLWCLTEEMRYDRKQQDNVMHMQEIEVREGNVRQTDKAKHCVK